MMRAASPIYLDYCASAPLRPTVADVMGMMLRQTGNASSVHGFGRMLRYRVDEARAGLALHFGVKPAQVIFTSGATESNNTALQAFPVKSILVSSIEHPSILNAAPDARLISVDENGVVDLNHLEMLLKTSPKPALVCVMLVNNETGVIQPVSAAAALCKNYGALIHCDAVAAVGRINFSFAELGVDSLSLCAHKIGGPQGVGALITREGLEMQPLMRGGGQEMRQRAGTENVAGIVGFSEALRLTVEDLQRVPLWASWRENFEAAILHEAPAAVIFGIDAPCVANIISLAMPGVGHEMQLMNFDLSGFAVSAGSACSSGKVQASHVLAAMGAGPLAAQAVRVSFGWATKKEELENFAACWVDLYSRGRVRASAA